MLISPADLKAEYERAVKQWPFIRDIEKAKGLPSFSLFAVGSRETNLTNEAGDNTSRIINGRRVSAPMTQYGVHGWGNGVWQRDSEFHTIPAGYSTDVRAQCVDAANLLLSNLHALGGSLHAAFAAYNCGVGGAESGIKYHGDPDYYTTHSEGIGYGAETLARRQWLRSTFGPPPTPQWWHRILRRGSVGADVTAMKKRLVAHGYRGMAIGPVFGFGADKALRAFQRAQKLTVDGACGPVTARRLG